MAVLCAVVTAHADDVHYGARAVTRVPLASTHHEDASASGTTLDLTQRVSLPNTLSDVVREAPGVNVLSTGGIGAFASAQLRGADGEETLVLLDEIPLSTPEGGAFDLSLFPPALFSQVDVFRGGAPVWLGSGAIGGVLRLTARRDPTNQSAAGVGGGSFGTLSGQARAAIVRPSGIASRSNVFMRHTDGDYRYTDDGNTRGVASDDRERRIRNGQLDEASGFSDLEAPVWGGKLRVFALGTERAGGFPGPASRPTPRIRRALTRVLVASAYTRSRGARTSPRERIQLVVSGAYGNNRYSDIYGQLGTSKQTLTDDVNLRAYARAAYERRFVSWLSGSLVSAYAYDRYAPDNVYQFPAVKASDRQSIAGAGELTFRAKLGPISGELRPSGRVELSHTTLHSRTSVDGPLDGDTSRTAPTVRVGAVLGAYGIVALSASAATGVRLPSMYELFGDRGLVLAAPGLKPVTSTSYDAGLTFSGDHGDFQGTLEARVFSQERQNTIALTRAGQYQSVYENIASVDQHGVEAGFTARFREIVRLAASFTDLETDTQAKKRLPFRPKYIVSFTPQVALPVVAGPLSSAGASLELNHRSFVFDDLANLAVTPRCTKLNLAAAFGFLRERIKLSARLEDVADARCSNLTGYPLPGRSVFFTVSYEEKDHASTT